jgi:hypothetical protein
MKGKIIAILVSLLVIAVIVTGSSIAKEYGYQEPAPESGDGYSNGSGFDHDADLGPGKGPAPNAGLGIHDGPGWPEE